MLFSVLRNHHRTAFGGRYFEDDLRSITPAGVNHVMRVFFSRLGESASQLPEIAPGEPRYVEAELAAMSAIVCDEEALGS